MIRAAHCAFGCHDPAGDSQLRRPQIERCHMAVAPCPLPVNSSSPPLSPTTRPSAGGPPPAAPVRPCCCRVAAARASSRSWVPATTWHVRRVAAARTQSGSWLRERRPLPSCLPAARARYLRRARHARRAPWAVPLHAPQPLVGARGSRWHSAGRSPLLLAPCFAHSRRGQGMVAYPAASQWISWSGARWNP
jgi:hypothetical protein